MENQIENELETEVNGLRWGSEFRLVLLVVRGEGRNYRDPRYNP